MQRLMRIAIIATCLSLTVFFFTLPPGLALPVRPDGAMFCVPYWGEVRFLGRFHVSNLSSQILNFINVLAFVFPPLFWIVVVKKLVFRLGK